MIGNISTENQPKNKINLFCSIFSLYVFIWREFLKTSFELADSICSTIILHYSPKTLGPMKTEKNYFWLN